ncbi:hypothetical protein [Luteipulveratus flavus]|uniref:Glycosyl transferase family 4 n=1 Tax=Luteipulveratus flavus TaxID=3031728 RepID=A0ABT6C6J8_9MICO|nr:hypothetical protein [Luteipulveratus sp. YIM 133296]MDF8264193.1 hypothetical protein [Luteipulveratus sp. YIM 133296]
MNRLLVAALAAGTVRAVLPALRRRPPGGARVWDRTNHAGRTVSLLEGPAVVAGCASVLVVSPTAAAAAVGGGAMGLLDDLAGGAGSKGLKGHLGALRRGEVTTGAVKVLGLGVVGVLAAGSVDRGRWGGSTLAGAGLVAGGANLLNLFDLRPGRALKVTLLLGLPSAAAGSGVSAGVVGAGLAALPEDLQGRTMMGDTGANALGALVGTALVEQLGARARWTALAVVVALTLASERVSFSAVIARTPGLRELDAWGRPRS